MNSTAIEYDVEPRARAAEFAASHQRYWERLARPGTWLTAAERVKVAEEARAARHCPVGAARRAALSPEADVGEPEYATDLPLRWREVIHRVVSDPGRLTRSWFDRVVGDELSPEQYVEIVGTLITVDLVDSFCRGLGVAQHPLPAPLDGEPTRHRPAVLAEGEAWVAWVPPEGATGEEADLWDPAMTANVLRALSLVPDEVRTLNDTSDVHYLKAAEIMNPMAAGDRALVRSQIELLAARTSALNQCFY